MRRIRNILIAAAVGIGGLLTATPAHAATGNVWVSFPTWLGNCPSGGSVTVIQGHVGNLWSTAWDAGDDLVYPRVNLNQTNTMVANVRCDRALNRGGPYWTPVSWNFHPTRGGQTWWMGPAGVRSN